ncbi:hypothetical protein ACWCQ0_48290 [Streptomyces massasporeus]
MTTSSVLPPPTAPEPSTTLPPGPGPLPHRPGRAPRRPSALLSKAGVTALLALATLYTLLPLTWLLLSSTKSREDLFGTNGFALGNEVRLVENLDHLFTADGGVYLRWVGNTVVYAGVGALLAAMFSVAAGYAFDKLAFPGKERLFSLVLLGVMVPGTALAIPLYLLAAEAGLVNTFWSVLAAPATPSPPAHAPPSSSSPSPSRSAGWCAYCRSCSASCC